MGGRGVFTIVVTPGSLGVMTEMPSDKELLAIYSSADGDGSSYEGWLSLYRAGMAEGIRRAREAVNDHLPEMARYDFDAINRALDVLVEQG